MENFYIIRVLFFAVSCFIFAILATPFLSKFLYKYKLGKNIRDDGSTPLFTKMHAHKAGTPTMGGILVWVTVVIFVVLFHYAAIILPWPIFKNLDFLSRSQTFLPFGVLIATALVGLFDD